MSLSELAEFGVHTPAILLPRAGSDLTKWAVIACDQYTSQRAYWDEVAALVGDQPSTLKVTLPEVYLEDHDVDARIAAINATMHDYLAGVLEPQSPGFIYVHRTTPHGVRQGLIVAIDLERYDYRKGSQSLVRATEETVIDRLPPRIKIRQGAAIELPHIMVLIDDPQRSLIEPIAAQAERLPKLYDFELMMGSGQIKGYKVEDPALLAGVASALAQLAQPEVSRQKYGVADNLLLFAVGDGNHSLASAKAVWESVKQAADKTAVMDHPARYALVELVNIYDAGLTFEPIHRVLFNVDHAGFFAELGQALDCSVEQVDGEPELRARLGELQAAERGHAVGFINAGQRDTLLFNSPQANLEVGTLQAFLDGYLKRHPEVKIDYVHGDDVVADLGGQPGTLGFYLPAMPKQALFKTVILDGALPRKTFSMGEAAEKRFYLESRLIQEM